ncbi:MAG: hypothetical protein LUF34_10380, partial [Lachnospiraceae bacterium]|nr:hypothetical protein [Lachnospiraceae bacterium]
CGFLPPARADEQEAKSRHLLDYMRSPVVGRHRQHRAFLLRLTKEFHKNFIDKEKNSFLSLDYLHGLIYTEIGIQARACFRV